MSLFIKNLLLYLSLSLLLSSELFAQNTIKIKLYKGWNLVSIPVAKDLSENEARRYFGTNYMAYDSTKMTWNKNGELKYGEGFWVKSNNNKIVYFSGEQYSPNFSNISDTKWHLLGSGIAIYNIKNRFNIDKLYAYNDGTYTEENHVYMGQGFWVKNDINRAITTASQILHESDLGTQSAKLGHKIILNLESESTHHQDTSIAGIDEVTYTVSQDTNHTICSKLGVKIEIFSEDKLLGKVQDNNCTNIHLKAGVFKKKYHNLTDTTMTLFINTKLIDSVNLTRKSTRASAYAKAHIEVSNDCSFCDLSGLDLSNHNLSNGFFLNTNFSKANLTNSNLTNAKLQGTTLIETNFTNANLTDTQFNIGMVGTGLYTVPFSTNAMGTIFKSAKLTRTNFNSVMFSCPKFTNTTLPDKKYFENSILDASGKNCGKFDLSNSTFDYQILSNNKGGNGSPLYWEYLNLTNSNIKNIAGDLRHLKASTAILDGITLSANLNFANFKHASAKGTTFIGAKGKFFEHVNAEEADFSSASFKSLSIKKSNFKNSNLDNALFIDSVLNYSNFDKSSMDSTSLTNSDLRCASFSEIDFTSVNWDDKNKIINDLEINDESCPEGRTAFRNSIFNASQISPDYWKYLDMERVKITDLESVNLSNRNFSGARFKGMDFSGSDGKWRDMTSSDLSGANLEGIDISFVNLSGGKLNGSNLSYSRMTHANLSNIDARGATMTNIFGGYTFFVGSNFDGADFSNSNFSNASFYSTSTQTSSAIEAICINTRFNNAILVGLDLSKASIGGANFSNAILVNAKLNGVKSNGGSCAGRTNMGGTHLGGTDLTNSEFNTADLTNAIITTELGELSKTVHTDHKNSEKLIFEFSKSTLASLSSNSKTVCPDAKSGPCLTSEAERWVAPNPPNFNESDNPF